jgi:hypothetical protein
VTSKKRDPSITKEWITQGREERQDQAPAQREIQKPEATKPRGGKEPAKRQRFTVNISSDLIEWARRCVVFTPGLSLGGLVEDALTHELRRLEKQRGDPFPTTTATPKKGRPITLNKN